MCLFIIRKRVLDKRNTEKFNELIKNIEQNLVQNNLKNINSSKNDVNIREVKYSKTTEDDNSTFTEQSSNINENQVFTIKDYTITEILDGLIKLEKKQYYLKQECTLHNVAKKLKTNTAYLSKIVNSELGKNFSAYINDLRINYVLIELKNNKRLRSYSIAAISEEVGYKSPDSFNKYFKEATGLTPSIFIKKINELEKD